VSALRPTASHLRCLAAFLLPCAAAGCAAAPPPAWVEAVLPGARPVPPRFVSLSYQAPTADCPFAYAIAVDYDTPPLGEEPSVSGALVALPSSRPFGVRPGPIPAGRTVRADLFYKGVRVAPRGARREVYLGRHAHGPAAPTAPCTARTWDPMEDFLALAFPTLPRALVAEGTSWRGARVEGRCNKTACIDPDTYAGGRENHLRPCVTPNVEETLAGVYETDDGPVAAIESRWSDGHGEKGIWMERRVLLSIEHGRTLHAAATIHHMFPQPTFDRSFGPITRTVTIRALDGCPGVPDAPAFRDEGGLLDDLDRTRKSLSDAARTR